MANTYTQIYFHVIFAVRGRKNLIKENWKIELYRYISGILANKDQKLMVINGMPDHIHLLIGTRPDCNLSDLIREVKSCSSKWVNLNKVGVDKFYWQSGFGAFSVSHSAINRVIDYIKYQEEHHRKQTFRNEYIGFLKANDINFENAYIF